jgi:hypothetical protein
MTCLDYNTTKNFSLISGLRCQHALCQHLDFILILDHLHQLPISHLQHAVHVIAHTQVVRDHDTGAPIFVGCP